MSPVHASWLYTVDLHQCYWSDLDIWWGDGIVRFQSIDSMVKNPSNQQAVYFMPMCKTEKIFHQYNCLKMPCVWVWGNVWHIKETGNGVPIEKGKEKNCVFISLSHEVLKLTLNLDPDT